MTNLEIERNHKKLRLTMKERLVFALFMKRLQIRFKRTGWVWNDLTAYRRGANKICFSHDNTYWSENYFFIGGVPLFDRINKEFVKRIRTGSLINIDVQKYLNHHFRVCNIDDDGTICIQSLKDMKIVLFKNVSIIKSIIQE